jgi:hypothetical protein
MTRDALGRQPDAAGRRNVTRFARYADMPSRQRKRRVAVIKEARLPISGVVTLATACSKPAAVDILLLMAGDAVARRGGEILVDVTRLTCRTRMRAHKWELRLAVVELIDLPACFGVTRSAVRAESPLVLIVLLVTCGAFDRSIAVFATADMTADALHADVLSDQRILGEVVVESRRIEFDDARIAPGMVRVTAPAISGRKMESPVKSPAPGDIGANRRVADVAQFRLYVLFEIEVARITA